MSPQSSLPYHQRRSCILPGEVFFSPACRGDAIAIACIQYGRQARPCTQLRIVQTRGHGLLRVQSLISHLSSLQASFSLSVGPGHSFTLLRGSTIKLKQQHCPRGTRSHLIRCGRAPRESKEVCSKPSSDRDLS